MDQTIQLALFTTTTYVEVTVSEVSESITEISPRVYGVPIPVIDVKPSQGEIESYLVIVEDLDQSRKRRKVEQCAYEIDQERAKATTFDPRLPYEEARACNLNYHLAAILDREVKPGEIFPIGDGNVYGGVKNVPLKEGTSYKVYYGVRVRVEGQQETEVVVQILEEGSEPITVPGMKDTKATQLLTTGQLVGVVVGAFCLLVISVALTLLIVWKHRRLKKKKPSPTVRYEGTTENSYDVPPAAANRPRHTLTELSQEIGRASRHKSTKARYENCPTVASPIENESEAIPVSQLKWYNETNQELILQQYEKLHDAPTGETLAALKPENRVKCRYKDLYPADEYRVLLRRLPSQGTDFINANFLRGYDGEEKYIAAQGPTNLTVEDFWLMIWQQDIQLIVMATRVYESNKMKCYQYWPETEGEMLEFGNIKIHNDGIVSWPDYTITTLQAYVGGEEKRLTHYQFTSWPDHDVPSTSFPFLTFYGIISRQFKKTSSPLLIHCSAGVGRTGTIIALDYLLAQAKAELKVDVYKCVKQMRKRRPYMIQTEEQYIFVHRLLYDAISTQDFLTLTDMLPQKAADEQLLRREYQYIEETLSQVPSVSESGKENKDLNRLQNILPDDKYRIYLNSLDGQTYINAVRVNGYRKLDQFYATQLPLQNTVKDFWQLVHERSCKIIVQLGTAEDNVLFYSVEPSTGYSYGEGTHTIHTKSVSQKGVLQIYHLEHSIRKKNLLKEPKHYTETSEVCLVKLPSTQCDLRSRTMVLHMISIAEQMVKLCQKQGDVNVLVTSRDGAELCGLFICSFNCLESIRLTQEVEVHSQVLLAKYRRRQFISTLSSYRLIYEILAAYAQQFSSYQNLSMV
ncbi:receptor-type tyrosine-protein phosphatase epsilon-like [Watersipora subatra]|uniref:receptor-type tyrosine-protein phosphatase epsilon-like n=1 Tax=Watersipora subatra TaxID=2589382 RepID=UPI00355AE489